MLVESISKQVIVRLLETKTTRRGGRGLRWRNLIELRPAILGEEWIFMRDSKASF